MKKIFEKYETIFCLLLIAIYILVNMLCIQNFGTTDCRNVIINTVFSLGLICLMIALKRLEYYGVRKPINLKNNLYFIPLLVIAFVNLWGGIKVNNSKSEIVFHILNMINIGFIEEVIFRGFLYKMMAKDNEKVAIIVSSITFGIGHVVNLFNGAELIPTLLQICSAIAIGYLFVIIFNKCKSIIPCVVTHILINSLSIFNNYNNLLLYISSLVLIVFPIAYAIYLNVTIKDEKKIEE